MGAPAGIDWEWAKATGGSLTAEQRRALLKPLARTVVGYVAGRVRLAVGLRGHGRLDIDALRWPDSTLAKEAEAQAREVLSVDLLAHSYRTYLFGLVLAQLDGVRVDEEVCYVASLLHDLQLGDPTPGRCFAVAGGERAERFALDQGTEPTRAASIGAAIAAHITAGASDDLADPGGFVSAGAFVDVSGARVDEMRPDWVADLLARHPRHNLKHKLRGYWAAESLAVPDGRARWLTRTAGLPLLVRLAPFDE
ncbi:MAG TPA: hypothetical protein VH141_14575 [Pseudonocardia sp.]|jgi:hypothetical protein|nr:hypothetical protein [Pseudonocardia sp.]